MNVRTKHKQLPWVMYIYNIYRYLYFIHRYVQLSTHKIPKGTIVYTTYTKMAGADIKQKTTIIGQEFMIAQVNV